jgi:integrase
LELDVSAPGKATNFAGLRLGELLALRWRDVDLSATERDGTPAVPGAAE